MIKSLIKHGNSHALVIDKAIMEALGIEPDSRLQLTLAGGSLTITPVDVGVGQERVGESLRRIRPRYEGMLRKLAE